MRDRMRGVRSMVAAAISPVELKRRLHDGQEIALLDVREHGFGGAGILCP